MAFVCRSGSRTILTYRNPESRLVKRKIPLAKLQTKWAYIVPSDTDLETLHTLVKYLSRKKIRIAINPSQHFIKYGPKKLKPLLQKIKVVILNREEASFLTKVPYEKERNIFFKLHDLVPGLAVMTDGPGGVLVSDGFNMYSAGIFKEKRVPLFGAAHGPPQSPVVVRLSRKQPADGDGPWGRRRGPWE